MCRFLLIQSKNNNESTVILNRFADLAEKSMAPDGDRQADGWGVAWIDKDKKWRVFKSLNPIWQDRDLFEIIPNSNMFVVHARSASFAKHKNNIDFNQPYIQGSYAFVFNGLLRGVSLNIRGKIGAEKIWNLLKNELVNNSPQKALENLKKILKDNSREIFALNVGLADGNKIYSICNFKDFADYYQLYYHSETGLQFVCSEKIEF